MRLLKSWFGKIMPPKGPNNQIETANAKGGMPGVTNDFRASR